jgi:hypothetical protein
MRVLESLLFNRVDLIGPFRRHLVGQKSQRVVAALLDHAVGD